MNYATYGSMLIPKELTPSEWKEMFALDQVAEYWQLDKQDTLDTFKEGVLAAKFLAYTNGRLFKTTYVLSSGRNNGPNLIVIKLHTNLCE